MTDFTHGQSDRDELARLIASGRLTSGISLDEIDVQMLGAPIADVLWAAGWRKKPSWEQVVYALNAVSFEDGHGFGSGRTVVVELVDAVHAILALLDGPTETGEK